MLERMFSSKRKKGAQYISFCIKQCTNFGFTGTAENLKIE